MTFYLSQVHYPTVRYHRDYDVANRPGMFPCGFGGVISFEVKGDGNPWSQETFDATARWAFYLVCNIFIII